MYRRLTEEKKQDLRNKYEGVQEYMITYNAITIVGNHYDDLCPEEIWNEALNLMGEISSDKYRQWKVQKIYVQLQRKYDVFITEDNHRVERSLKDRERTATLVLFDVLIMLTLKQKVENILQHPYYDYICAILNCMGDNILFETMWSLANQDEVMIEQIVGQEILPQDYLAEDVLQNSTNKICPYIKVDLTNSEGVTKKYIDDRLREKAKKTVRQFIAELDKYRGYLDFGDDNAKEIFTTFKRYYKDEITYDYKNFVTPFYQSFPEVRR